MALTCRGCRYLSAFGTSCLLGRDSLKCKDYTPGPGAEAAGDRVEQLVDEHIAKFSSPSNFRYLSADRKVKTASR